MANASSARQRKPDLLVHGSGTIYTLHAVSRRGQRWIGQHIADDAPRLGTAIAVEHRFIRDIVLGARADGLRYTDLKGRKRSFREDRRDLAALVAEFGERNALDTLTADPIIDYKLTGQRWGTSTSTTSVTRSQAGRSSRGSVCASFGTSSGTPACQWC